MRPARICTLFLIAAVGVGTIGLTGCTEKHDLPTLGGPTVSSGSGLEAIAKTYYDCMNDAGMPVQLIKNMQDQLAVVQFSGEHDVMWYSPEGGTGATSSKEDNAADQQAMDEFFATASENAVPALVVDGVDHSDVFAQCLAESSYNDINAWGEYQQDPAEMQRQVDSNNKWAACARENGWPDIQDSSVPTDNNTWPVIKLPSTITEDQLRQLVDACPNFDPAQEERLRQWWNDNPTATGYPDDYLPSPTIDFDAPDWSTAIVSTTDPDWKPNSADEADMQRIDNLYQILYDKAKEYYDSMDQ